MTAPSAPGQRRVYTIGHSNHEEQTFLDLLLRHGIEVVADVRSQPYSKYTTQFNSDQIKPALAGAGINYVFLGRELGGRPDDPEFYDAEGRVRYDRVAESPLFRQGIERVEKGIQKFRVARRGLPRLAAATTWLPSRNSPVETRRARRRTNACPYSSPRA